MFCNKCGKEISNDSKCCTFCGSPIIQTSNTTINVTGSHSKSKTKKQIYQKTWFWILIVFLILIVIGMMLGNNNQNTISTGSLNTVKEEKKTNYKVGETFSDNNIKLTYVSLNENFKDYNPYATVKSGYKIVKAEFEFENIGNSDKFLSYGDFNCYADGYTCDAFYSTDDAGLSGPFVGNISAGKKARGNVYFEVPKDAKKVIIEYSASVWSSKKIEFIIK